MAYGGHDAAYNIELHHAVSSVQNSHLVVLPGKNCQSGVRGRGHKFNLNRQRRQGGAGDCSCTLRFIRKELTWTVEAWIDTMAALRNATAKRVDVQEILDGARELFANEGYERTSILKLARKIGCSPTPIYMRFSSKDELLQELYRQDFARLNDAFRSLPVILDPVERIEQIARACAQFGGQYPKQYKLMFLSIHPPIACQASCHETDQGAAGFVSALLRNAVREAVADGHLRSKPAEPDLLSDTLWATIHGAISLEIAKCNGDLVAWTAMADRVEAMLNVVLGGIRNKNCDSSRTEDFGMAELWARTDRRDVLCQRTDAEDE